MFGFKEIKYYSLHEAVTKSSVENLKFLLDRGYECPDSKSKRYDGKTALHLAVLSGSEPKVRLLLERGASIDLTDNDGNTALHMAFSTKNKELVEVLLENGANCNSQGKDGKTPLHIAVHEQFKSGLKTLLAAGVNGDIQDDDGSTVLHMAIYFKYESTLRTLMIAGVNPNIKDNYGQTPLHIAICRNYELGFNILLAAGVNPNIEDEYGQTPLHYAVRSDLRTMIKSLLASGANVNSKDKNGETPLHEIRNDASIAELLLTNSADINAKSKTGQTPLFNVVLSGNDSMVKLLLAKGSEVNIQDKHGHTPLLKLLMGHPLAKSTSSILISELMAWGATVEVNNKNTGIPQCFFSAALSELIPEYCTKIECANLNLDVEKHESFRQHCSSSFQALCFDELKRIKAIKFGRFPLNDIFAKYSDPLYCLSEELEEETKPNSSALDSEFPLYAPLLRARFFKAKQRLLLLHEAQSRAPFNVPEEIKRKILSFVDSKDLGNVVKAFRGAEDSPCS